MKIKRILTTLTFKSKIKNLKKDIINKTSLLKKLQLFFLIQKYNKRQSLNNTNVEKTSIILV